jgi:hypothetical protein
MCNLYSIKLVVSEETTTKTGRHDIAEILLKVALKHQKSNLYTQMAIT